MADRGMGRGLSAILSATANATLEGLASTPDGRMVVAAMEGVGVHPSRRLLRDLMWREQRTLAQVDVGRFQQRQQHVVADGDDANAAVAVGLVGHADLDLPGTLGARDVEGSSRPAHLQSVRDGYVEQAHDGISDSARQRIESWRWISLRRTASLPPKTLSTWLGIDFCAASTAVRACLMESIVERSRS